MLSEKTGTKTQIAPHSPDYAFVEYALQLALHSTTSRVLAVYAITNPHTTMQFDKRSKDILTVPCWVDSSELSGANTEEDVVRRGFRLTPPQQGLKFVTGPVTTHSSFTNEDGTTHNHPHIRKAVFCQVAVGRAFVSDQATAERTSIPDGYDSFYIKDPQSLMESSSGNQPYVHEYFVKNMAQVLPMFIVHYEHDPNEELKSREKPYCENCENELATVYCSADMANLCNKCDTQLHQTKLTSRHVRTPLGMGNDLFGTCRLHPEKQIEFFCSSCHIPVCVVCKMVGNHANGEAAKHQLVSVTEAYQTVLQESQLPDPVLQNRRTEIANQISAVHSRARAVEKMGQQIEANIEDMYKKAMRELKDIIESKLTVLLGDELELKRQMTEIDRLEGFLKYQMSGDATTYLFNWSRHQKFRQILHDFRFFRNDLDVELDAKLTGTISVIVDKDQANMTAAPNASSTPHPRGGSTNTYPNKLAFVSAKANPIKMQQSVSDMKHYPQDSRRVQLKTSDFFAETLGNFEHMSMYAESEVDHLSEMGVYRQ